MSLELTLSQIIGVECGNVHFSRDCRSYRHPEGGYVHGTISLELSFTTRKQLLENSYGSVKITSMGCDYNGWNGTSEYTYAAVLIRGENTSKIAEALADELFWKD